MKQRLLHFSVKFLTLVLSITFSTSTAIPQAEHSDGVQRVARLNEANSLDVQDRAPFHIRISFDLYDLDGKPKETGTIDEWWAESRSSQTIIAGPSLDSLPPGSQVPYNRETYLAKQLLRSIVHPVASTFADSRFPLSLTSRADGASTLDCVARAPSVSKPPTPPQVICTQASSDSVTLLAGDGDLLVQREGVQNSHGIELPSTVSISYLGRKSIVGRISLLEDIDAKTVSTRLPVDSSGGDSVVNSTVLTGIRLTSKTPVFPKAAKKAHHHGAVTLIAIITKQGSLRDLDIVATPDALFSQSAIDAVQAWTYQPYLLNGLPTEVETTITVNYNLGGKS